MFYPVMNKDIPAEIHRIRNEALQDAENDFRIALQHQHQAWIIRTARDLRVWLRNFQWENMVKRGRGDKDLKIDTPREPSTLDQPRLINSASSAKVINDSQVQGVRHVQRNSDNSSMNENSGHPNQPRQREVGPPAEHDHPSQTHCDTPASRDSAVHGHLSRIPNPRNHTAAAQPVRDRAELGRS